MRIRSFKKEDIAPLVDILRTTSVFRPDEIAVAVELMNIVVDEPQQRDYIIYTAVDESEVVRGYYCVGPTPMTIGTFDLYWIAVDPAMQRRGVGKGLLQHCEALVKSNRGRLIVVETSSQPKYDPTRNFYLRSGYREEARIRGYYAPDDDLIVYTKQLSGGL